MLKLRRQSAAGPDPAALIPELQRVLPVEVVASLVETGEVAGDDPRLIEAMLRRFLVAEKLDVHRAALRLERHAAWRRQYLPAGFIGEDEVKVQAAQDKVLLQPPGQQGSPLLVIRVARHQPMPDIPATHRFVIYCLEAASRMCDRPSNPGGKLWALFDLEAVRWANLDAAALKTCFSVLNAAFPERVRCIYMLNSPLIFDSLWRIVSPFIDPVTRAKVRFVSGPSAAATLLEAVGPEVLPAAYGGAAEEVLVQEAVRRQRGSRDEGRLGEQQRQEAIAATQGAGDGSVPLHVPLESAQAADAFPGGEAQVVRVAHY